MQRFLDSLKERVLIGDGAMGTRIYARGVALSTCYEELNLSDPRMIRGIHDEYVGAGAEVLETNSFQANRIRLARHGLEGKVLEINAAAARLAREAAGKERYVAGSVGPITAAARGAEYSEEERLQAFREQIQALVEGGCDAVILETFMDLKELRLALKASRLVGRFPVLAQMSFHEKGRTPLGVSVEEAVATLEADGADAIGVNCSRGPYWVLGAVERMARLTSLPISAFPNAGLPEYVDGRVIYLTTPEYFAGMAKKMADVGSSLIGGCCGTDASHIRALAEKLRGSRPGPRPAAQAVLPRPAAPFPAEPPRPKALFDRIGRDRVIVVELDPPRNLDLEKTLRGARKLRKAGVDAITVGDNPLAVVRVGNLAVAALFEREGVPTIAHISCRDRNLIASQSRVLEAHVLGITSLLAITGDPARVGDQPDATSVYDLNSVELIRLISRMNSGQNFQGNPLGEATQFWIGCAFNPNKSRIDHEISRLKKKIQAGAHYALAQPCYDPETIEKVWTLLAREVPGFPVFYGFLPPVSARNAEFLANEVPGITMPRSVVERIRAAPEGEQMEEGMKVCRELIEFASRFTTSFYMVLPFNRTDIGAEFVSFVRSK